MNEFEKCLWTRICVFVWAVGRAKAQLNNIIDFTKKKGTELDIEMLVGEAERIESVLNPMIGLSDAEETMICSAKAANFDLKLLDDILSSIIRLVTGVHDEYDKDTDVLKKLQESGLITQEFAEAIFLAKTKEDNGEFAEYVKRAHPTLVGDQARLHKAMCFGGALSRYRKTLTMGLDELNKFLHL